MAEEKNDAVETAEPVAKGKAAEPKAAPSKNIQKIIEAIEKMTVLEMAELVKTLEDKFGVTAAAPVAMAAMPAAPVPRADPTAARAIAAAAPAFPNAPISSGLIFSLLFSTLPAMAGPG